MPSPDHVLNRLTISRQDLEKTLGFLDATETCRYGSTVYEALLLAAVVCYSRPFSSNEKDSKAPAASKIDSAVLGVLDGSEQEFHQEIVALRNKAVAHSEWARQPTRLSPSTGVISSMPFSIWSQFKGQGDIEKFRRLADKVLLRTHHLSADLVKELKP